MTEAVHVGYRALAATDPVQGARVPLQVFYPTHATEQTHTFGPYTFEAARDAAIAAIDRPGDRAGDRAGDPLPLVVISHGRSGSPWAYRWLALPLARAGFLVAAVEHPGDSRSDSSLTDTPANLANRPRHVRIAIDAVLADPALAEHVASKVASTSATAANVAVIGHSIGAYTALAIGGGKPLALPNQTPDGVAHPVDVQPDPRVGAVVLLAPALPWLMAPGALADVRARVFARTGTRDDLSPPMFVEQVLRGLPAAARLDYAVVPEAGHFAFWGPVPAALAGPHFPPGIDPPGFDRAAYQARLVDEILAFLSDRDSAAARG